MFWVMIYTLVFLDSSYRGTSIVEIVSSWWFALDQFLLLSIGAMYYGFMWKMMSRKVDEIERDTRNLDIMEALMSRRESSK